MIICTCVSAQEPEEQKDETPMKEMVITATRREAEIFELPYSVGAVDRETSIERAQVGGLADMLQETPGVMAQKTARGQGSPFIRGFTGFRNVLLIDGIRLNNSVFRDGPNQYWGTVDPLMIERLEVVRGPASVLYGSDAIGGAVNALTIGPGGPGVGAREYLRYGSADESYISRTEVRANYENRVGVVAGGTWRDINDLDLQPKTGYFERNFDVKVEGYIDEDTRVVAAHQLVNQDDLWRTHKTIFGTGWHGTTVGSELKRVLDQDRRLTYVQLHAENLGELIDTARVSLSWHVQEEEQYRVKGGGAADRQGFSAGT
ncbi:MAG: TonB-dependent receptor plug domain-containing protein, partial [Planctomycetota bacterium]